MAALGGFGESAIGVRAGELLGLLGVPRSLGQAGAGLWTDSSATTVDVGADGIDLRAGVSDHLGEPLADVFVVRGACSEGCQARA